MVHVLSENQQKLYKESVKSKRKSNLIGILFAIPYLLSFLLFFVVPLVWGIFTSFFKYNPYDPSVFKWVGLSNFKDILGLSDTYTSQVYAPLFWKAMLKTVLFDLVAVPCLIIIPLVLAYFIYLEPPGYKIFRAIIYFPSLLSVATMGIVFVNFFSNDETGFINSLFNTTIRWLDGKNANGVEIWRWIVMLIASIWWQTGSNFIIFSAGLKDVDKTLYEASRIDGCSKIEQFFYVTIPGIKNQMVICLFMTLIGYLNLYAQPSVIASAGNKQGFLTGIESPMQLIQTTIMTPSAYSKMGLMCATGLVFGLMVMLVSLIQMKATEERRGRNKYAQKYEKYFKEY